MEKTVTDANIVEILASDKPVMIDFWATWCGPCRMLAPTVEEIAKEYEGKAVIGKCNVDEASETPMKYGIRNIPTLLFFKGGQLVDRLVGAVPKNEITAKLDALL
ncbi:MAG TPA: thioredoxin [Candidatus Cryptobacteroides intestinipullorum]|nr:thioredoxin [Candidatus Cryptobacteroides intestinipullorum]